MKRCYLCRAEFSVPRNPGQRFCSVDCRHKYCDPAEWIIPTSANLRFAVLSRDGFRCYYCGSRPTPDEGARLEVEHVWPRSAEGDNRIFNLVTSCQDCNRAKGAKVYQDSVIHPIWSDVYRRSVESEDFMRSIEKWRSGRSGAPESDDLQKNGARVVEP